MLKRQIMVRPVTSSLLLAVVDDSQKAYQDAFEISKSKMQVKMERYQLQVKLKVLFSANPPHQAWSRPQLLCVLLRDPQQPGQGMPAG